MKKDTRQVILEEALSLFSVRGYEGVTVQDIAEAVGIKAPSLYKHYKSKQDIFDAILTEMDRRYQDQVQSMQMNGTDATQDVGIFLSIGEEQLIEMGKALFFYFLHDDYVSKFRRMLTIEQYRSPELASLYTRQYVDEPLAYQGMMFGFLSGAGALKQADAQIMALHFYAPIYLMLISCDSHPEKEAKALQTVEQHIRQFKQIYGEV